jgi:dTDP-4-amino-4,6-dideoxygalactose transaminase
MVDKYTWVDVGSSYVPSELCSAILYAQLELLEPIARRRREIYNFYYEHLLQLEGPGFRLPVIPKDCKSNYHMFYILLPNDETRNNLMAHLKDHGITAPFHYVPLHTSPVGSRYGYCPGDLPVTENLSGRLLRLPFYCEISETEQSEVVAQITRFVTRAAPRRIAA